MHTFKPTLTYRHVQWHTYELNYKVELAKNGKILYACIYLQTAKQTYIHTYIDM